MLPPVVSVLLPFHNAGQTLAAAVGSIRAQTLDQWELILFDDGSRDPSPQIASDFAAHDARIRVVHSGHVGIVQALRRAADDSSAPLLARMDADDVAAPARLDKQVAFMRDHPDVAVCGTQVAITGSSAGSGRRRYETWVNALVSHEAIVRELFVECPLPHPTFMMCRSAYDAVGGYQDVAWPEDYDLCMRFFLAGLRFGKVPDPLLEWADTPGRLSMTDPRYSPASFRALKRHYLRKTYLKGRQTFFQWGAGEVGKRWLREWDEPRPSAVVDINPRKISRTIHGVPVIAPEQLPPPSEMFAVVTVGTPGARDDIRQRLNPRGYRETVNYLFLA